jgi:hypothetical protein
MNDGTGPTQLITKQSPGPKILENATLAALARDETDQTFLIDYKKILWKT